MKKEILKITIRNYLSAKSTMLDATEASRNAAEAARKATSHLYDMERIYRSAMDEYALVLAAED